MAMRRGNSMYTCRECGAGVGTPRIMTCGVQVPRSDPLLMTVGSVAVAEVPRACFKVDTRRSRKASAAPDPKGKKIRRRRSRVPAT